MTSRTEEDALHGPWPGDGDPRMEAVKARNRDWRIWRAVGPDQVPGEWCARRTRDGAERYADSADQLEELLREAGE